MSEQLNFEQMIEESMKNINVKEIIEGTIININKKRKIHPGTYDRFPLNSTDMHYTGDRVLQ